MADGAKSTAVTSNPFFAKFIASYPLPHPMIQSFFGCNFEARFLKKGVSPPKSQPASSFLYIFSQNFGKSSLFIIISKYND